MSKHKTPAGTRRSRSAASPGKNKAAPDKRSRKREIAAITGRVDDPHAEREAQRYERPIPSREAILDWLERHGEMASEARIAEALALDDVDALLALRKRLAAMLRDGQLLQGRRGDYAPVRKLDLIPGEVIANAEGYGFLRPDDGGDDLYLSPQQMRTVLHGDRVLASVVGLDRRGRRQGAIVEVLQRRPSRLVGRVVVDNGVTLVTPDDRRLHQDIMIVPGQTLGATSGQIVVAEITDPPTPNRGPLGAIRAVLGDRLKPSLLVEMAIASFGLPVEWPADVLRDAAQVAPEVSAAEREGRVDLRGLPLVTIDGADAKDFDDAVYAEPRRGGGWRLVVAIADVSHYVRPGTALDSEGQARSTSTYFPGYVVPMLPETLSNGICSLNPKVERLCTVCDMQVDADGEVARAKFYAAVMRSHARLTYDRVWQAIGLRDADARAELADVLPQLEHLHALYGAMAEQRRRRGAIDFETPEVKFRLDARGEVENVGASERNDAHKLIEECMIAANVQAALFLDRKKVPALYRVHEPPPAEKYEDLQQFLRQYKLRLPPLEEVVPGDFAELLRMVRERPERELIQSVLLRAQSMAAYQPEDRGHFGLALSAYAHFTSPIRRYPDLLVHRAIRHALTAGKPADYRYSAGEMATLAVHCSQRERAAEEAERDVNERFKCAWLAKHVGSEFDGTITGVTSFGLFVELHESRVSGLVHISQLANDYYHFDPARRLLKGEHHGQQFRLGDRVRVQVLRASLEDRKIDFRLVPAGAARPASPTPTEATPRAYGHASTSRYAKTPGKRDAAPASVVSAANERRPLPPPSREHPPSTSRAYASRGKAAVSSSTSPSRDQSATAPMPRASRALPALPPRPEAAAKPHGTPARADGKKSASSGKRAPDAPAKRGKTPGKPAGKPRSKRR